jgi:hypothetical protein
MEILRKPSSLKDSVFHEFNLALVKHETKIDNVELIKKIIGK